MLRKSTNMEDIIGKWLLRIPTYHERIEGLRNLLTYASSFLENHSIHTLQLITSGFVALFSITTGNLKKIFVRQNPCFPRFEDLESFLEYKNFCISTEICNFPENSNVDATFENASRPGGIFEKIILKYEKLSIECCQSDEIDFDDSNENYDENSALGLVNTKFRIILNLNNQFILLYILYY